MLYLMIRSQRRGQLIKRMTVYTIQITDRIMRTLRLLQPSLLRSRIIMHNNLHLMSFVNLQPNKAVEQKMSQWQREPEQTFRNIPEICINTWWNRLVSVRRIIAVVVIYRRIEEALLHAQFWEMNYDTRRGFIRNHITVQPKKRSRPRSGDGLKNFSRFYTMPDLNRGGIKKCSEK